MIRIEFEDGGTQRSLEILADSFGELRPVMAQFTRWMREEIDRVFSSDGDGAWPKRSDDAQRHNDSKKAARVAKIRANTFTSLRGALRSERRKAERRLEKSQASSDSKLSERRRRAVARYEAMQVELERFAGGGTKGEQRQFRKLYERIGRREVRAQKKIAAVERGQLLGQVANSLTVEFDRGNWEMFSQISWAGIHNEGGQAGNNATIPARTFLEWTPARLEKFVEMANQYLMERAEKAAGRNAA